MPPTVTARVHAIADGTAARGTVEVLALIEPLGGMWSITVITIATRHIMRRSPSRHKVQESNRDYGSCQCSHYRPLAFPSHPNKARRFLSSAQAPSAASQDAGNIVRAIEQWWIK
jgi:hypothetical protein